LRLNVINRLSCDTRENIAFDLTYLPLLLPNCIFPHARIGTWQVKDIGYEYIEFQE